MKMFIALITLLFALVTQIATAGQPKYKYLGNQPSEGKYENRYYAFSFGPPDDIYDGWELYEDANDKRSTVLHWGLNGVETFALAILHRGKASRGATTMETASKLFPSLRVAAVEGNQSCVTTVRDMPIQLTSNTVGFMAICLEPKTRQIYEVSLTWQSVSLLSRSFEALVKESETCVRVGPKSPATKCHDYVRKFTASYNAMLDSLVFTGE